ncbi:MAG: hypothetical protein IJ125_08110 [Atopobiaceae bacterium]|nr:hypothetical protein [Atopobiaceae bacterium]
MKTRVNSLEGVRVIALVVSATALLLGLINALFVRNWLVIACIVVAAIALAWLLIDFKDQLDGELAKRKHEEELHQTAAQLRDRSSSEEIVQGMLAAISDIADRDVAWYPYEMPEGGDPHVFHAPGSDAYIPNEPDAVKAALSLPVEASLPQAYTTPSGSYRALRSKTSVLGVLAIMDGDDPTSTAELNSIMTIADEAARALERSNAQEAREQAAITAQNEKLRSNLLLSISHDLRTPLTSISGNADVLMTSNNTLREEERTRLLTDIYDDALWLNQTVENLLTMTRLENDSMSLKMDYELMDDVIEEALHHVSRKLSEHEFVLVDSDELLLVRMNARLIALVIINLINNAIIYTQPGSTITLSTKRENNQVIVSVADNGPGIPDADKQRVFDPFGTATRATARGVSADTFRSFGLGLSLSRSIITAHNGTILVEDNVPSGCIFRFSLPAEEAPNHVDF